MGVPTSEVGYTPTMPRREGHEVHKRTCGGIWEGEEYIFIIILILYVSTTVFITQGNYVGYMFRLIDQSSSGLFFTG